MPVPWGDGVRHQGAVEPARAGSGDDVDARQRPREAQQLDVRRAVAVNDLVELARDPAHPDREAHPARHDHRDPQLLEILDFEVLLGD